MANRDMYCTKCFNISPFCSIYVFQCKCKHFTKYATIHWKCQSSCYKSTKRCVQTVKLNSFERNMCFHLRFWKNFFCRFILRTYLVLVMHVYCVANCGHTTASLLALHPCNTTRYQNNLSLVGISSSNSFIFSLHSLSLSLSLSHSPRIYMLKFQ